MRHYMVFLSIALLSTRLVAVCGAPQPRLVCAEYFKSEVVVEAKLVRSRYVAPDNDNNGHVYRMQTEKVLRGKVGQFFDIWEDNSSGRAAFDWETDRSYLLFLNAQEDRGWTLDGCGNSGPLGNAGAALKQIQGIPSQRRAMIQVAVGGDWLAWSPPIAGVMVSAQGPNGTYSATTSKQGIAEIYVPAGKYSVTVPDQKVLAFDLSYDDPEKIVVENGGCAQIQFVEPQKTQ